MRKLRKLRFDAVKFMAEYNDAVAANLTVREFCQLTGTPAGSLHNRLELLAQRGFTLPMLRNMKKQSRLGVRLGVATAYRRRRTAVKVEQPVVVIARPVTFQAFVGTGF
jgi:hypothetical protein